MKSSILHTLALVAAIAVPAPAAVTSGLVHHWNFDDGPDWHDSAFESVATNTVALDLVGGANAVLVNMTGSNWVSGRQFTALQFDGVNEYLSLSTNLASTLGGTASLSLWLRTTQPGGASASNAPGIAGVAGTGTQWAWLDDSGRIGLSVDNTLVTRSAGAVNDGNWHHVVLTRDAATGAGQVYLDGALSGSATGAAGTRSTAFTSLGRIENGAAPRYFAGRLDQAYLFNRVITLAEVQILRTNAAPKAWDVTTAGVNSRAFSTASIFSRTYDVENDAVTVSSWGQPAHGSVTYNGDGSFTYTAAGGYVGADSFPVVVSDGQGGYHRAQLKLTVMAELAGSGVPVTQFTNFASIQTNGVDIGHSGWRVPRAVDWNNDGKTDLLIGAGGYVWRYMNTGTVTAPSFAPPVKVQAAGADIYAGTGSSPITLIDMTGDGVNDLVLADSASKLRVYRNTAGAGATPVYAAATFVKDAGGADFAMPDRRFDLGDWNGDGKPDLVTGTFSGDVLLYLNTGTASDPRFSTRVTLFSGSYQLYPRMTDLNGNGITDLLRGINWGDVVYWRDPGSRGLGNSSTLSITYPDGTSPDLHGLTDGAVVDFADFNGDGLPDLVAGGQGGGAGLYLAFGSLKSVADSIATIEAIYDANPGSVGIALSANANALLNTVNNANWNLVSRIQNGTLGARESVFNALTNHIAKYPFLKYQALDTTNYHHVPSIALQNWVMLQYALADTPARRTNIADVMGLSGTMRTIYLESGMALGDNAKSIPAAYGTIRDFLRRHPRELFPDAILSTDQLYGDGRGGFVWTPNSTKNTFGDWAVGSANEWAGDLTSAIEKVLGAGAASGDYFTFVMGHEVTHSMDGYVNSRANANLRKRWGLALCTAAGPDIIPGSNGWIDWTATKANFQSKGYWDGVGTNWSGAWSSYWTAGVGAKFESLSYMRGNIDWFLENSQESLATQANHHWANGPGRLIGAADRFRRGSGAGLGPLKANINEVVTFIDFLSVGMNRVNLVETKYQASPKQVNWYNHYADLERDDRGYIRRITLDGRSYLFGINTNGVVTNLVSTLLSPVKDSLWTFRDTARQFNVVANDSRLEGGAVQLAGVSQPAHGTVATNSDGTVIYTPAAGYSGSDSFSYSVTSDAGGSASATAYIEVINPSAPTGNLLVEYWNSTGTGSSVSDLTGNANFPGSPSGKYYTNGGFELRSSYGEAYGTRCRGLVIPPATGNYTFWIASDDGGELWMSPGSDDRAKTLVAYTTLWAGPREWTKYASQQSIEIPLVAGERYYIESLHKEGSGGDNLAVGWAGPSPLTATNVIASAYLKHPFFGYSTPKFNPNPLTGTGATAGIPYAAALADNVTDTNSNETLLFSKLSGPAWLSVAANGALSGTPGPGDTGTNSFNIRVMDSTGFIDNAIVRVAVVNPAPPVITSGAAVTDANFNFQLSGVVGQHYRIEYTPALPPTNGWLVVTDIVSLASSPLPITIRATNKAGFYRAGLVY